MNIAIAADHAGFPLKEGVIEVARKLGHEVTDLGTCSTEPVDYPDMARSLANEIQSGRVERGVLVCGSGIGACVAINKFRGIRGGTCHDTFSAHQSVEDDNSNVMCLGARVVGPSLAAELVKTFLNAKFSGAERHVRRVRKIAEIEAERFA
jgi:ribose 5-phosphate isomerase B